MPKYRQTYTLFKRGRFYYYRTYTPDGVRTTARTTGCTSRSAAKVHCDTLFKEGKLCAGSQKTLAQYARGFFAADSVYSRDNGLSASSIRAYCTAMDRTLLPRIGRQRLADITHSSLKKLRQDLLDSGLSAGSVKLKMSVLHIVLKSALADGIIQRDPFYNLHPLKEPVQVRDAFTLDELRYLYDKAGESVRKDILLLATTGMRVAELAGVSPQDVEQEDGTGFIRLEKQYAREGFLPLKNKKPRDIPLCPALQELAGQRSPEPKDSFYSRITPLIRQIPGWHERKLCLHSLRHFFISSAKSYGINHLKVETIAGHSLKGIQAVYTSFRVKDLADITEWQEWALHQIRSPRRIGMASR